MTRDQAQREVRELVIELVKLRKSLGTTQADIARNLGVTQVAVLHVESGRHDPKLSTLLRYAGAAGLTLRITASKPDDLADGDRTGVSDHARQREVTP